MLHFAPIKENDLKRVSEGGIDNEVFFDKRSISSESNCAGYDGNELIMCQQQQQSPILWDSKEIEKTLTGQANNAEEILNMIKNTKCTELVLAPSDVQLALLYCSLNGYLEYVSYFLDHCDVDPNCCDSRGRTSLHFACYRGNAYIAKVLLDHGADPNRWDAKKQVTPLHCAASAKSVECILLLLKRKAHINIGLERHSALHFAIERDAVECCEVLLKYGANPNTPQVYTETPLHTACAQGFTKCVELLLNHDADVRSQYGESKMTALHLGKHHIYILLSFSS